MPDSPFPFALAHMGRLHLRPLAAGTKYKALVTWESFANDEYQLSTIEKEVTLYVQANEAGYELDFCTDQPALTKPEDLEALEEVAIRLAALYQRVVVQATPAGRVEALLNHNELLQTWSRVAQELRSATTENDQVTKTMLDFLHQQMLNPAHFLQSLRHDYLYQTLVPDFYGQPLGETDLLPRSRQFSNFFDKTPLWFTERVEVLPEGTPEQLMLRLHGPLDAQQTDLPTVQALIAKALQVAPAAAAAPAGFPTPHFKYEAIYVIEVRTGLPMSIALHVSARAGQLYNKEYTLIISRQ